MRKECAYRIVSVEDGHTREELCGKPSVGDLDFRDQLLPFCAEHYDTIMRIRKLVKRLAQDWREKNEKNL